MRFDQSGISLWYGTPDAPGPEANVPAGAGGRATGVVLVVAVQPLSSGNRLDVYYRVNGGAAAKVTAQLSRTDSRANAQYFTARFPSFNLGDHVEYGPVYTAGGVQIPSPSPPAVFPSSFRVGGAADPPAASSPAAPAHAPAKPAASASGGAGHIVDGLVSSPGRGGLAGVRVEIVDKNPGPHVPLGSAVTDAHGRYTVSFGAPRDKTKPDLCARAYAGETFLGASPTRYDAATHETLDVMVPAGATGLPSEYETLTAALSAHHAGKLGDLQETEEREDITYLAHKTGWDARAIAFAALADKESHAGAGKGGGASHGSAGLEPAFYYGLFRARFPTDPDALYETTASVAGEVWKQAIAHGVIPRALEGAVAAATKTFEALASAHLLDAKPATGLSTLRELLQVRLGADTKKMQTFADLFTRYKEDLPTFWREVEKALGVALGKELALDEQLAHLTLNNAPLLSALYKAEKAPFSHVYDLVLRGYWRAAKWAPLVGSAIPKEIEGSTIEHRRSAYAEYLAAQMRVASPLGVIAEMIQSGALPVPGPPDVKDGLHAFFAEHNATFELGEEPIARYVARNHLTGKVSVAVVAYVERLQRVYQITPSDDALLALFQHDLDSAYAVTRYSAASFVRTFGHAVGGEAVARQIHAKATLVHGTTLNLVTGRLTAHGKPGLSVAGAGLATSVPPAGKEMTLDQIFGSMDFCACADCRSILSPAAYLVDLLNFVDDPHAGAKNPQRVLFERRPDLQHLPLSCENTNTALPYIDLVNETLEYFVANRTSLAGYQGHTTAEGVTSDELMASPQFVSDAAYETLRRAPFPPPLPFDRSLALLRLHLGGLGMPLHDVLRILCSSRSAYGWTDVLMERAGLSPAEHRLLTDGSPPLAKVFGIADADHEPEAGVVARLSRLSELCRRCRVSYEEMGAIVRTRFINPDSAVLTRLDPLCVPFTAIQALKTGAVTDADFEALLPPGLDPATYGAPAGAPKGDYRPILKWLVDDAVYARIMGLVTIAGADDAAEVCSADELRVRYARPDRAHNALRGVDLVRLSRFIRLHRKLGLTVEQTDAVVSALYPADQAPSGADEAAALKRLDAGFGALLARLGSLLQIVELLSLDPVRALPSLLACWAPIGTGGARSLYRTMFLSPSRQHNDPAFVEGPDGSVLQDATQKLWDHEPAIRSALNLTGAELALIAGALVPDETGQGQTVIPGALGFDASTPLTLDNVSAIHRRGWLARALRLSVVELLGLVEITGLDPFSPLDPVDDGGSTPNLTVRAPPVEPPAIRFIRLVQALHAGSLKPVSALYLVWNHDVSGKSAPPDGHVTALARALRADFAAVESQFAPAPDPNGDVAKGLMGLVYGAETASFFFGLLDGTMTVSVPYAHPDPALPQPVLDAASGRLHYDPFRKQLAFGSVLDDAATLPAFNTAAAGAAPLLAAIAALSKANHRAVDPFFAAHPKLPAVYAAYAASKDPPEVRRTALLAAVLPDLKQDRKNEQALASVTSAAGVDPTFAPALLIDPAVLHAANNPSSAAVTDVTAIEAPGLSAQFFVGNDPTAAPDSSADAAPALLYTPAANPLPAGKGGGPIAGVWSGFVDAPKTDFYDVQVTADAGAAVTLLVDGVDAGMTQSGGVWQNASPIQLKAGTLSALRLTVTGVKDTLLVTWQTGTVGAAPIPAACLYGALLVDRLRTTYLRFLKAASLGAALSLSADEVAWLAASSELSVGGKGWLSSLTTSGDPDPATASRLGEVLSSLLDFARIKAALSPSDDRLLAVMKDPTRPLPNEDLALGTSAKTRASMLLGLTRWAPASMSALLVHFFGDTQLSHLSRIDGFRRIYDAYAAITATGVSAAPLLAAMTNAPTAAAVGSLEAALRARHAEADWLTVVKPIHDKMRTLQRDALVAYVLQHLGERPATADIDTPDKLFEYFLMDVEMMPCSVTSRVRLALSSIQLFVERVLRGLELEVDPSHIAAAQWEWMKRYRVWQANREIFLWPENWLDPELRDDPSPFFQETMGSLLQGDITDDAAEAAFLAYLTQLEEVAKLEPCGLHHVAPSAAASDDVTHVVARTAGANRKHYYRRQDAGSWTPWEEIKLEIEDNPVVPLVWNDRLLLLWLRVLKQAPPDPTAKRSSSRASSSHHDTKLTDMTFGGLQTATRSGTGEHTEVTVQAVLCWSERYNGTWQATKTSDVNAPVTIGQFPPGGPKAFDRSRLQLAAVPAGDERLVVDVLVDGTEIEHSAGFVLYNTHSLPVAFHGVSASEARHFERRRAFAEEARTLRVTYEGHARVSHDILRTPMPARTVEPQPGRDVPADAPLFFEDSRHAFYVTTTEARHALAKFKGFGFGRAKAAPHPGKEYVFPPIVTPHASHPPPAAHAVQYGGHKIGHAGAVKRAPTHKR